jgi:hypothetical protein
MIGNYNVAWSLILVLERFRVDRVCLSSRQLTMRLRARPPYQFGEVMFESTYLGDDGI